MIIPNRLLLLGFIFLSNLALSAQSVEMHGIVMDQDTRSPLVGASVSAAGEQATKDEVTDSSGRFLLRLQASIRPGDSIRIRVRKSGYVQYDAQETASSAKILPIYLVREKNKLARNNSMGIKIVPLRSTLEADQPFTVNYTIKNAANIKAEQVTGFVESRVVSAPISDRVENELFDSVQDRQEATMYGHFSLEAGGERTANQQFPAMSEYWVNNIRSGKNTFVVAGIMKYRYEGHSRETDFCWVYNEPKAQLNNCHLHNQIRDRRDSAYEMADENTGLRFSEDAEKIVLDVGKNTMIWNLPQTNKKFSFDTGFPITLLYENRRLYVDANIYSGPQSPPVALRHNRVESLPLNWDMNSNDKALEIVDENLTPVFQIFYRREYRVAIMGFFPAGNNVIYANFAGTDVIPEGQEKAHDLPRLFKYPSWKFSGEYEPTASDSKQN